MIFGAHRLSEGIRIIFQFLLLQNELFTHVLFSNWKTPTDTNTELEMSFAEDTI